jgi:hypothetical protein
MCQQMVSFRQKIHICMVLLILLVFPAINGCTRKSPSVAAQDEQRLRKYWQIPDRAALISLTSNPQPGGTFGREGLRIYAVFRFSPDKLQEYRKSFREADWLPLPIAANIFSFQGAPVELPRTPANGVYICDIAGKPQGQQTTPQSDTGKELSGTINKFDIAFLNFDDATLHVIYKVSY